ncbi:MAG: 4Fe-4S dicluster domain-containing protein [Anaerolineae bacterium]
MELREGVLKVGSPFLGVVNQRSGQVTQLCYHCHKCTAGCPVAFAMDYGPDRLLRMIQFGLKEQVLCSSDIWICASCETCGTRCPNEIDIARVMDALRQMAVEEGLPTKERNVPLFHNLFLSIVKRLGRMHEASLMGLYKPLSRDLFSDIPMGLKMILKGKIPLLPHRIKGNDEVEKIFERSG